MDILTDDTKQLSTSEACIWRYKVWCKSGTFNWKLM